MKKLLKTLGVNQKIYNRLDDGEKSLIKILALTVPVSAMVTGLVFYYAIDLLMDNILVSATGGIFIGLFAFLHDSTMLSEKGIERACFRLVLSLLFAIIMAVPVKVKLMGDTINKVYANKIEKQNRHVDSDLLKAKEVIFKEEQAINSELAAAGKRYDQNNKNTQQLTELRRKKKSFLAQKEMKIQELEKLFEAKKKPIEASKIQLCAFFYKNFFSGDSSPEESLYNGMILIILLMFESLPAIIRLKLDSGEYLKKVDHRNMMTRKVGLKRERLETQIYNGEVDSENLEEAFNSLDLLKELEIASQDDSSQNRGALIEKAKQIKGNKVPTGLPAPIVTTVEVSPPDKNLKIDSSIQKKKDNNDFPKFDYSKI
jgi:hypothetical protein